MLYKGEIHNKMCNRKGKHNVLVVVLILIICIILHLHPDMALWHSTSGLEL